ARRGRTWSLSARTVCGQAQLKSSDAAEAFAKSLSCLGRGCRDSPELRLLVLVEPPNNNNLPDSDAFPAHFWLVEVISEQQNGWLKPYLFETRPYISISSTRPEFAFLMANLARISAGAKVLDPVCGSGGLLLVAAACGALRLHGIDANREVIEGRLSPPRGLRGKAGAGISDNFAALGLPLPRLQCQDALAVGSLSEEDEGTYD
ncbi:unnamed protein product, partial [Polarella glacialis]